MSNTQDIIPFSHGLAISFEAIGQLFLVVLVGFFLVKRKTLSTEAVKNLTRLMIDVIVPCALAMSMVRGFRLADIDRYAPLLLFPAIWIGLSTLFTLGYFRLWRGTNPSADRATTALAAVQNSFYIPLPIAMAVLPASEHATIGVLVGVCVLAVSPLQWTLGTWLVMGEAAAKERDWKRSLAATLNAPIIGITGGAVMALFPPLVAAAQGVPDSNMALRMIYRAMELIGKAMNPMAMLILGAMIAETKIRGSLNLRLLFPVVMSRFVIVPGLIYLMLVTDFIPTDRTVAFLLLLEAASPSAMNLALAAKRYDGEWEVLSTMLVYVNGIAVITLPIWMTLGLRL